MREPQSCLRQPLKRHSRPKSGNAPKTAKPRLALALLLALSLPSACKPEPSLLVYAASSLAAPFEAMTETFEAQHNMPVTLSTAGSQQLRLQIEQGAPADVFASANLEHMQSLIDSGAISSQRAFASNTLVVAVPAQSRFHTFADLAQAQRIVVGVEHVPVGAYTVRALEKLANANAVLADAIRSNVVSREPNVRLTLAKVEMGEADAAFVYRTDAERSAAVRVLELPAEIQPKASYHVAIVGAGDHQASAWIDLVLSSTGQAILREHGVDVAP